ncbi:MAG: class I SAM-dependent methyltransferase [Flavobacteriales bacterium]|nr:class I SAM-dependent methyltransferase [Flavobacteriales bacterium]
MMNQEKIAKHKAYWEENIARFSGFYDEISQEELKGIGLLAPLYKKFIFPLEKEQMTKRNLFILEYIDKNVSAGMLVADIGCGSGLYTKTLLQKGAKVIATDFAQAALDLTKAKLNEEELNRCQLILQEIGSAPIPKVDLVLCIGVLPYIDNFNIVVKNLMPQTNKLLFNYLKSDNVFNIVRSVFSFLNVRNYSFFNSNFIKKTIEENGFNIVQKLELGTGEMLSTERIKND